MLIILPLPIKKITRIYRPTLLSQRLNQIRRILPPNLPFPNNIFDQLFYRTLGLELQQILIPLLGLYTLRHYHQTLQIPTDTKTFQYPLIISPPDPYLQTITKMINPIIASILTFDIVDIIHDQYLGRWCSHYYWV